MQLLSGETIAGRLVELGAQGIAIRTAKGRVATELGQLAGLTVKSPQPVSELRAAVWIELVDGSVLAGTSYTSAEGRSKIALLGSAAMEISTQEVKTVRFQAQSDVVSAQWTKIVDTEAPADFLVLRKEDALDYHRGAIRGVTADTVRFELDGEVLSVKSAKVYGIVYHHPQGRQLPDAICSITDISGSSFAARTVAASGDSLQWTTPAGVTISRPAASVARIELLDRQSSLSQRFEARLRRVDALFQPGQRIGGPLRVLRTQAGSQPQWRFLGTGRQEVRQGRSHTQPHDDHLSPPRPVQPFQGNCRNRRQGQGRPRRCAIDRSRGRKGPFRRRDRLERCGQDHGP